ncbi:Piso0_000221 [Millerozyma farinosa CBS 7064]|uniref:Transcription factor MBP1 n=1 Tax=Pichia sorbitophila (strain ATCC MYA-4447 / BCRC 22081 / CBS 7064 / NBRC 10061 / NRRL Y-12695) TaxID=559304 RepID=G8YTE4_PICSO|nr:Piso0_000221 [Millerozyma farinosa CBS 7064]
MGNDTQIYSATYSNVPVFEYVTSEGPIMRRKSDSWINATHILKIAKFPKAKRTRILEKDVQTGIHEKVQGGYGKYQGTYVPLDLGAEIARSFGIYETLRPIFEFKYVEGRSATPPPAPKHNHASASNIAKRMASAGSFKESASEARKSRSTSSLPGAPPRKRGRPKRNANLNVDIENSLKHSDTAPLSSASDAGPSIGTFNTKRSVQILDAPTFSRQDTEQDSLQVMANNMGVKSNDLEMAEASSDDDMDASSNLSTHGAAHHDEDELMSGHELFGTPRESFEKIVQSHNQHSSHINGSVLHDPYGLHQYHHSGQGSNLIQGPHGLPGTISSSSDLGAFKSDSIYSEYFITLLNYFLEDGNNKIRSSQDSTIPDKILHPPQPLSKMKITQPIDNEGNTIFHWACSMANDVMIQFLLTTFEEYLGPDLKNNNGETPLMFSVKFSNAFQMKNFSTLIDLLFGSLLSVDNYGRTILHHIAIAANGTNNETSLSSNVDVETYKKNKMKFAKYYMECLFAKLVEFHESSDSTSEDTKKLSGSDANRKDFVSKFINHQDIDGNTAFHLVAYHLNKKCIKVFLAYHKYINFSLRNLVGYTVEEYLASHNHVLRLYTSDKTGDNGNSTPGLHAQDINSLVQGKTMHELVNIGQNMGQQGLEAQLFLSRKAVELYSSMAGEITEQLARLTYVVDSDVSKQDEMIIAFHKLYSYAEQQKQQSQRSILQYFSLEHLIDTADNNNNILTVTSNSDSGGAKNIDGDAIENADLKTEVKNDSNNGSVESPGKKETDSGTIEREAVATRDKLIQDEISRLMNDLSYQDLFKRDELDQAVVKYKQALEILHSTQLEKVGLQQSSPADNDASANASDANSKEEESDSPEERMQLAVKLQTLIAKRRALARQLPLQQTQAPLAVSDVKASDAASEERSENKENINTSSALAVGRASSSTSASVMALYPRDDRINKYCRLIALCCGMNFEDVENAIDLIEQSLASSSTSKPSL